MKLMLAAFVTVFVLFGAAIDLPGIYRRYPVAEFVDWLRAVTLASLTCAALAGVWIWAVQ